MSAVRAVISLPDWENDAELRVRVEECARLHRAAGTVAREAFRPRSEVALEVAPGALEAALERPVSDVAEDRGLSNCIAFNFRTVAGAVMSREAARLRRGLDRVVDARLRTRLRGAPPFEIQPSGCFWYPPGSYMGWHTNLRLPGWRLYLSVTDEPGNVTRPHRRHPGRVPPGDDGGSPGW